MIHNGECLAVMRAFESDNFDSLVTDPPAGISFMGKDWDTGASFIPKMTEIYKECLRVLKPGAHGLVWALPRTSHWTATALEQAGFEIRDVVTHLFGTGFPKSLDISKAIDKAAGAGVKPQGGLCEGGLAESDKMLPVTAPATDAAKQWQGWGTALKPASEHWILIRKPLSEKTVAANVLKHGTGGINIDGCRIGTESTRVGGSHSGRFPSNLILGEEAAAMLDEQSGHLHGAGNKRDKLKPSPGGFGGQITGTKNPNYHNDNGGGASRFFYCAKASKSDRGTGNNHPTVKSTKLMSYLIRLVTPPGGIVLDPFCGSGSTGVAAKAENLKFVGIEQNAEYVKVAERRVGDF